MNAFAIKRMKWRHTNPSVGDVVEDCSALFQFTSNCIWRFVPRAHFSDHYAAPWYQSAWVCNTHMVTDQDLALHTLSTLHAWSLFISCLKNVHFTSGTCSFLVLQHHAADTYKVFTDTNEDLLKSLPPPVCALEYYRGGDLYMFDAFMTTKKEMPRRPPCKWAFISSSSAWLTLSMTHSQHDLLSAWLTLRMSLTFITGVST